MADTDESRSTDGTAGEAQSPERRSMRDAFDGSKTVRRSRQSLEGSGAIDKTKAAIADAKAKKKRFDGTHLGKMLTRAAEGNSNVLAGGMAYFSLTALSAALVIGVTISSFMVQFNENWNDTFYSFIDDTIPGVVKDDSGDTGGLIDPGAIQPQTITGVVGVVSFLILFNTAARYLTAVRVGTRTMLGKERNAPVQGKLRDFGALLAIGVIVVVGMAVQVLASQFAEVLASWIPGEVASQWIIRGPALLVGVLVDMAFLALAMVVLGRYRGAKKELFIALIAGAIAIGILRQGVSFVVGGVGDNPVLGSFAAVLTILIFADWVAKIMLFVAAWLGTLPEDKILDTQLIPTQPAEPTSRRDKGSVTTARATERQRGS
ncbi:YihY/virulence factor BrkB family protein [Demequina sediminicola]|uniref:YihY/virulence factor BrkB family protein n=1 Tax=Demequina sediminicola TaxID=1095026 RepID=UPI0007814F78|nr:YhjD/YihY/BrkB family envelope integrity protein [Demequina sediminicola]